MDFYTIIDIIIGGLIAILLGIQWLLGYMFPFKNTKFRFTKKVIDEIQDKENESDRDTNKTKRSDSDSDA